MTGSPLRRLLPVLALVLAAVGLLSPAGAVGPPLSSGCTTLHNAETATFSAAAGHILLSDTFAAGEQVRFTITGSGPSVGVTAPGGSSTLAATSGQPVRYDVTSTGGHTFVVSAASGSVSLKVACGIPPKAVVTTPAEGATYGVNDTVTPSVQCVDGTNAASCSAGPVDTSTAGAHTYTVVASDSADLQTKTVVHYTVDKKAQTLHFTSAPITDAIVGYRYNYTVTAESDSGLEVELSTDPNTPACAMSGFPPFIYGNVVPLHAGTCTVFADQPGNDQYAPAERITMTFQIGRELTTLEAFKASKGILGISGTTFKANLHYRGWFGPSYGAAFPYPGQEVKFYVGGKLICSAVTVQQDDGSFFGGAIATCKAPIGVQAALKYNSYTAVYASSQDYLPSTAIGKLQ